MPGRILVVDDIATNRAVMRARLGARYYETMEASCGEETVETAVRCDRYLAGSYRRGDERWPVFDLFGFVESNLFLQAAEE